MSDRKVFEENTIDVEVSSGVYTCKMVKMKDMVNATSKNETMKSMQIVAASIIAKDGKEIKLNPMADLAEWPVGDFQKIQKEVMEFSGIDLSEFEAKN